VKAFAASVVVLALSAGAASASVHRHASLKALNLTPPTFRGAGFKSHERVTVTVRGASVPSVHVTTGAGGRFRVRLAAMPSCRAWTVRARGAGGGTAVYHHSRCASLKTDVTGVVWRGPIRNVCSDKTPCSAPDPGVTVQAFEAGSLVAETTTDDNGRYSFSLADGQYTIQVLAGRRTKPRVVQVQTSNPVHLDFLIDTGIR
jgi:hypothetical protein